VIVIINAVQIMTLFHFFGTEDRSKIKLLTLKLHSESRKKI